LYEEIEEDRLARKVDHGQPNKRKNPPVYSLENYEKDGKTGW
jgi:hypothetical protein